MFAVFIKIFQNLSRNLLKWFSKCSYILNSHNFPKYFSKISDLFLEIILRNFPKYFSKVSEVFLEISKIFLENFEIIFEIFRNNSQNFPKYFSKCYEMILKILRNNYRKFSKVSGLFLEIIHRNFPKYFLKVSEIFLEISKIFLENFEMIFEIFRSTQNFSKYFSKHETILKILCNNYRNFPKLFEIFQNNPQKFR